MKVLDNKLHSYTNNSDLNFKEAKEASARGVWIFSGKRIQVIELQYMTVRANIKLWHFAIESNNLWNISEKRVSLKFSFENLAHWA